MGSTYYKVYKGKRLGPYSYERPIHRFTPKDVARIAKTVSERDGYTALEVFAAIAIALGFGALFCRLARSIGSALSIMTFFQKLTIIFGTGRVVTLIIEWLIRAKLVAPKPVGVVIAISIAALMLVHNILKIIPTISGDLAFLRDTSDTINGICAAVRDITGEAIDNTCDATGEACESIKELGSSAAYQLKSDVDKAIEVLDMERPEDWSWFD